MQNRNDESAGPHPTRLRTGDLDPDRPTLVETPWGAVALYLVEGEVRAFEAWCPHMEGPLFQGTIGQDGVVTCPWHAWRYELCKGKRVDAGARLGGAGARALIRYRLGQDGDGSWLILGPKAQSD